MRKRKFALYAQCYNVTKAGKISKREAPKYNVHSLEDAVKL